MIMDSVTAISCVKPAPSAGPEYVSAFARQHGFHGPVPIDELMFYGKADMPGDDC